MKGFRTAVCGSSLALAAVATHAAEAELDERVTEVEQVRAGVHPGGGGFFIETDELRLRVLGYVQAQTDLQDSRLERDASRDFHVRRARINFLVDLYDDFEFFMELDGAPEGRTALVEARLNWRLRDDALQLRAGKFTSQFSTENARSSRSIDTIERHLALNSMFLLPALDTQFGVMLHGRAGSDEGWSYSLGVYNGNSSANENVRDDNNSKELQAKITRQWDPHWSTSLAVNYSREEEQELALVDTGFNSFVAVDVEGVRRGLGGDVHWERGPWSVRAEGLFFRFDTPEGDDADLAGGFIQTTRFIDGDEHGGTQALLRLETSRLNGETGEHGDAIHALTAGVNWFLNPNVRVQVNGIAYRFNGTSPQDQQNLEQAHTLYTAMGQLQYKF